MKSNLKQFGFTLIEVLIALVILAVALTAVIKATQDNIRGTARVQDRMVAHWVAMNIVAKIQTGILSIPVTDSPETGWQQAFATRWRWQAAVAGAGNSYYERINVNVYRGQQKKQLEHLIAFVHLPKEKNNE